MFCNRVSQDDNKEEEQTTPKLIKMTKKNETTEKDVVMYLFGTVHYDSTKENEGKDDSHSNWPTEMLEKMEAAMKECDVLAFERDKWTLAAGEYRSYSTKHQYLGDDGVKRIRTIKERMERFKDGSNAHERLKRDLQDIKLARNQGGEPMCAQLWYKIGKEAKDARFLESNSIKVSYKQNPNHKPEQDYLADAMAMVNQDVGFMKKSAADAAKFDQGFLARNFLWLGRTVYDKTEISTMGNIAMDGVSDPQRKIVLDDEKWVDEESKKMLFTSAFVAVGMNHIPGLIEELEKEGWTCSLV